MTVSATTNSPRTSPSQATSTAVRPADSAAALASAELRRRSVMPADLDGVAVDDALDAEPLAVDEALDRRQRADLGARGRGDGPGDRVLGRVLQGAAEAQQLRAGGRRSHDHVDEAHPARGHGAGLVEHDGVDPAGGLEDLGPLDQQAELRAAAGPDQQGGRRGQPERAGAGDDQHRDGRGEGVLGAARRRRGRSRASPTAMPMTTGTKTPEMRSASRWTGALPDCASVTSRAIWASAVSEPIRVARTTRRPPALTVAPATASPTPFSTGTDSPVSSDSSIAERPSSTMPSVAIFSPGRTTNRSPTASCSIGIRRSSPSGVEDGDVLGAELEQRVERGAGPALGARLEVAAGEHEGGDDGADLEVHLVLAGRREAQRHAHVRQARVAEEQRVERPDVGRQDAEADQRVHRRRAVPEVGPRRLVERPRAPQHDRRGQLQDEPLPAVELQRADHRQQQRREAEQRRDDQPVAQRRAARRSRSAGRGGSSLGRTAW